jgi:hypothetical protein
VIEFIIIVVLLAIMYEDFRHRAVRFLFFPLLCGFLIVSRLKKISIEVFLTYFAINIAYIFFFLGVGFLYLWIKKRKIENPFNQYLGWGDVFFLLAISCWFEPVNFMFFNVISLWVALFFHIIRKRFLKFRSLAETIPLAGVQCICFLIVFMSNHCFIR